MRKQKLSKRSSMRIMLSCLIFGFLVAGTAAAEIIVPQSGTWTDKQYAVQGGWSLEKRGDQHVLLFSDSFNTKSGPDLKIFLSPHSIAQATGANATDGALLISPLEKSNGAQEYLLPAGFVASDFKSLLIHCEAYSVLWGGTDL